MRRIATTNDASDDLTPHLTELHDLFAALHVGASFGLGVYDADGRPVGAVGIAMMARVDVSLVQTGDVHLGAGFACCRVGPMIFAVQAGPGMPSATLARTCRIGAGFLARTIDLLHQARALHQLVREQEAIIDHISDGLLVLDRSGILRYLNAPAGRILGIDPRTGVGHPFRDLIDFEPIIGPIFATGKGYVDRELRIRTRGRDLHLIDTAVPIRNDQGAVISIVNTFREMARVQRLSNRLTGDRARYRFGDVLGTSRAIRDTVALARRAARSDSTVLLCGESGTGKEIFAQAIHNEGRRASGPFVAVNCAALPRDLIESEMFGYAPGSFTGADKAGRPGRFEIAAGGTILLDEISEMPLDVQAKLLRVLQERQVTRIGGIDSIPVDVRVVAAANRDLQALVNRQAFRADLFYRLNVVRIDLPPLRERREDIVALIEDFLRRCCATLHRSVPLITPHAMRQLESFDWPGNVRQLQNMIERLINASDAETISELPPGWLTEDRQVLTRTSAVPDDRAAMSLEEAERWAIRAALEAVGRNVTQAANLLGISRPTLYAKMKRYGLALSLELTGA